MLLEKNKIPNWFSFPEVVEELKKGLLRQQSRGLTIFFTGLPSAGKSTLAHLLYSKLLELEFRKITLLDGDIVRQNLSKELGFSKKDRDENIKRIGFVASEITKHGGIVICAAIAPYRQTRDYNRSIISENGRYIEIYLSTPLDVCKKRDIKGLYKGSDLGITKNLTGIDDPYEIPLKPELTINTVGKTPEECINKIVNYLQRNALVQKYIQEKITPIP